MAITVGKAARSGRFPGYIAVVERDALPLAKEVTDWDMLPNCLRYSKIGYSGTRNTYRISIEKRSLEGVAEIRIKGLSGILKVALPIEDPEFAKVFDQAEKIAAGRNIDRLIQESADFLRKTA